MAENIIDTQLTPILVENKSPKDYWQTYLALQKADNLVIYQRYLSASWVMNCVAGVMVVGVENQVSVDWLSDRYTAPATRYLNGITLGEITQVIFVVAPNNDAITAGDTPVINIDLPDTSFEDEGETPLEEIPILLETAAQGIKDVFLNKQAQYVFPRYYFRYLPFIGVGPWWTLNAMKQIGYLENTKPIACGDSFQKSQAAIARVIGISKKTVTRHLNSGVLDWFFQADKTPKHKMVAGKVQKEAIVYTFHSVIPPTPIDQDAIKNWLYDNGIHQQPLKTLELLISEATNVFDVLPKQPPKPTSEQKFRPPFPITFGQLIFSFVPTSKLDKDQLAEAKKLSDMGAAKIENAFGLVNIPIYFMCHALERLGPIGALAVVMLRRLTFRNAEEVRLTGTLKSGRKGLADQMGISDLSLKRFIVVGENNIKQRKPNSSNQITLQARDKVTQLRALFRKYVTFDTKENKKGNISAKDALTFQISADEPLSDAHTAEYQAALQLISTFLKATNGKYSEEDVEKYLDYLTKIGLFDEETAEVNIVSFDKDNIVPINEVNNVLNGKVNIVPIGEDNNIPIGEDNIVAIGKVNNVPNTKVNIDAINKVKIVPIFKYFKYLQRKDLINELLNLNTINQNTDTKYLKNSNYDSKVEIKLVDGDEWQINNILDSSTLSNSQKEQLKREIISVENLSAWLIYAYLPENNIQNIWAFVYSQARENPAGANSGRLRQLLNLGPRNFGKLIEYGIYRNGYSDQSTKSVLGWDLFKSLLDGKLDDYTLLELGERLGTIRY